MKKRVWRVLCVLMTCALLCTVFCGCDVIDELRAANATQPDDRTVVWNGATYIRLDALKSQKIEVGGIDLDRSVYINTDNVPALLLSMFCAELNPSINNVFLCYTNYDYTDMFESYVPASSYYCREDRFDDVVRQLRDGLELTGYMYEYYDFEEGESHVYNFTQEEIKAFESVIFPAYRWGTSVYDYDYYLTTVYASTNDNLLDVTQMYEIMKKGDTYFVAFYPEVQADYYWDDETVEYYRVPKELNDVFERMLEKSMSEYTYWEEMEADLPSEIFFEET
ncbi:MAG: hypothetical protein IJC52_01200 [Clostridia bacterium]|nr:hypothetical protein [Clostridia bacterium]